MIALLAGSLTAASAAQLQYSVSLDGPSDLTTSPGTGFGMVTYDNVGHTLLLQVTFSGLVTTGTGVTATHIHAATASPFTGTAGVATVQPVFPGFPTGVRGVTNYSGTLDLTQTASFNAAFVTANGGTAASAEAALAAAMAGGKAYWNIHSSTFGGGEIRGFLVAVPEPSTLAMLAVGMVGLGGVIRSRRSRLPA